jgi:bifunctional DNA-binding transcriptional regulator/antitoxin component of YhaV-PrlF toxin-antitoxin module
MITTLSERGQTAVPARIRKRFKLKARQQLEWADDGKVIYIIPVARDPITAFRGSSPGGLTKSLLASRREDAARR